MLEPQPDTEPAFGCPVAVGLAPFLVEPVGGNQPMFEPLQLSADQPVEPQLFAPLVADDPRVAVLSFCYL